MSIAVHHHLDAHRAAKEALANRPDDPIALAEFNSFDPATMVAYQAVVDRARALSDKHLSQGMFRRGQAGAYTAITRNLLDTKKWLTHGQVIDHDEANEIGLNVEYRRHAERE